MKRGPDAVAMIDRADDRNQGAGTLDSPESLQSYEAGFDLFDGVTLKKVMRASGLKMQTKSTRSAKEWPSRAIDKFQVFRRVGL